MFVFMYIYIYIHIFIYAYAEHETMHKVQEHGGAMQRARRNHLSLYISVYLYLLSIYLPSIYLSIYLYIIHTHMYVYFKPKTVQQVQEHGGAMQRARRNHLLQGLCTKRPTPYTLRPSPYTLHPTPHTLHTTFTLHPTTCTLPPTPSAPFSTRFPRLDLHARKDR